MRSSRAPTPLDVTPLLGPEVRPSNRPQFIKKTTDLQKVGGFFIGGR